MRRLVAHNPKFALPETRALFQVFDDPGKDEVVQLCPGGFEMLPPPPTKRLKTGHPPEALQQPGALDNASQDVKHPKLEDEEDHSEEKPLKKLLEEEEEDEEEDL